MTASEPISHRHRAPWPPDDALPGPNAWHHPDIGAAHHGCRHAEVGPERHGGYHPGPGAASSGRPHAGPGTPRNGRQPAGPGAARDGWQQGGPAAPSNGWHAGPSGWQDGASGWQAGGGERTGTSHGVADDDELPIVAAYMVARGRVAATPYNRTATVYGRPGDLAAVYGLDPAHLRVLDIVNVRPSAVAEIAALMNVPVVAVRVLLDELVDRRLVAVSGPDGPPPSPAILSRALAGLRTI
ncbi:hypothetical protein NUM_42350 [Actinocatenispora comari]|uniref:DUF742 domain-containing protein n=1 Tax=Actinocatenispora comari TaxID=2807577 RepID=A0A8J4ACW1_9ACTN|nr:hypothetical protein NUM_42350 [Actinocatenispora comari]